MLFREAVTLSLCSSVLGWLQQRFECTVTFVHASITVATETKVAAFGGGCERHARAFALENPRFGATT